MLKAPYVNLPQQQESGLSTFLVLERHPEQLRAEFVRGLRVSREEVWLFPVSIGHKTGSAGL